MAVEMKETRCESHISEGNPYNMPSQSRFCNARSGMKQSRQTRGDKNSTRKGHVGGATLEYAREKYVSHFSLAWHIKFQRRQTIMSNRHIPSDNNNLMDFRRIDQKLSVRALEKDAGQIQVSDRRPRTERHDGLYSRLHSAFICRIGSFSFSGDVVAHD